MFWQPQGLGGSAGLSRIYSNPRFYPTTPPAGAAPFALPQGATMPQAQQAIMQALRGGQGAALDAYFKGWTPPAPAAGAPQQHGGGRWSWLQQYLANPSAPGAGAGGPGLGGVGGVWKQPSGWPGYVPGSGPLLPSTGQPMY